MFDSLLPTKLYLPHERPDWIARPRLVLQLKHGPTIRLILVSAPAGYGKTTLISSWLRRCQAADDARIAWLALHEEDASEGRFFSYLAAAIAPLPDVGNSLRPLLAVNPPLAAPALMRAFIQDVSAITAPLILALDDYHVLESTDIDRALAMLLDLIPLQMTLVLTSRTDPGFPLSRLRARGELIELRASDLRFTEAEATQFLRETMGLTLPPAHVAALEKRTEGWIAGLQMAALSLQRRVDAERDRFVQGFTGSHRYVLDYLVEETLAQQTEARRAFLLATSILDRMCGPLCDAVTGQDNGQVLLEELERDNLFVVPLDDERCWYRYHGLFADVLRAHVQAQQSQQVVEWHRRAAGWFAIHDQPDNAVRHALAAGDYARAASLLEQIWPAMDSNRQATMWLKWARALPDEIIHDRPVLIAAVAWAWLEQGELERADSYIQQAEQWSATGSPGAVADTGTPIIVDRTQHQLLSATIASARTYLALAKGDTASTVRHAQQTLDLLPHDDHARRGVPASLLSLAAWAQGDLATGERSMVDAMSSFRNGSNLAFAVTGAHVLADIHMAQGRLNAALDVCRQALQLAEEDGTPIHWSAADVYTGLADIQRERNDLDTSAQTLQRSQELGESTDLPRWRYRWCLVQARLQQARGDLDGALTWLDQAEQHQFRGPVPDVRPVAAWKTRIWIAQERLADARAWADAQSPSADDAMSYLREFEQITLARLLLAEHERDGDEPSRHEARALLDRLLHAAEAGERMGSVLEILVLQAVAHHSWDETDAALRSLERALELAAPEGYVRVFLNEGPIMNDLLNTAMTCGVAPAYGGTLLAEFDLDGLAAMDDEAHHTSRPAPDEQPLIEPLSERELDVLHLIAQGLSNQEISTQLFIALSTVKGHNRNIYAKLQVQRRTEAVARARTLGIL